MSVIRSFIFFNIKYEYNITLSIYTFVMGTMDVDKTQQKSV